jgi:hypothetical protein
MDRKKDRKKLLRQMAQQAQFMDLELTHLFIEEMKLDRRLRRKGLRLAKKRKKQVNLMVI